MICTYNPFGGDLIFSWVPTLYLKRSRWFHFWNLSKKYISKENVNSKVKPSQSVTKVQVPNAIKRAWKAKHSLNTCKIKTLILMHPCALNPKWNPYKRGSRSKCVREGGTYSSRSMGFEIRCVCCCHYYSVVEKKKTSPLGCYEILLAQWNPGRLRVELQSKNTWENWGWLQSAEQ